MSLRMEGPLLSLWQDVETGRRALASLTTDEQKALGELKDRRAKRHHSKMKTMRERNLSAYYEGASHG